jgi:DNA-binding PadR family transcriptional regulator
MTNAELAILSLIVEQPRHGYEIERVIEERGMREWTEVSFSSIYYLLDKLQRQGLVKGHLATAGGRGPARKVYRATAAGLQAFRAGVLQALSVPARSYPPLQLGLACLPGIAPQQALAALRRYRDSLAQRLAQVQQGWDAQRPLPYFVDAMFDHSVTMIQAELHWIEGFITQMEAHNGKTGSAERAEAPVPADE